ncbi:hypothetical protein NDU88_005699 [Pleurodeles waltl]|uniref:Uncharacterized protein n=1 Tax=Pleurodeles waltl TaxID=8319 RepID=A0AAV7SMF8_PLEWA|nr:hypothetical protein NDU88_005699 [Pleurodeles waltl]
MDVSISSLMLETKSIRSGIAGFQSRVTGLEHRMGTLEAHMTTVQDRDQDLLYLRSKITDLEDRSRRDNLRLFGFLENEKGPDVQAFLGSVLPKLTSLTFDTPLEFQRAHRVGPKHPDRAPRTARSSHASCDTVRPHNSFKQRKPTAPFRWKNTISA